MAVKVSSNLSPFYVELAKKNLSENPAHIQAHLTAFKRWLSSCPHLTIPQDDAFLLGFLRYAHYDHSVAQKRIDNFCSIRCLSKHGITEWYKYPKLTDPIVDVYLDAGILVPLGIVDSGVHIFILRLKAWQPDLLSQTQMRALNNMNFERFILDERCQIGGVGIFIDLSGTTTKQISEWTDPRTAKSSMKLLQEATPGRTKHLIFYKESKAFDIGFKVFEFWLSDKMKQRASYIPLKYKNNTNNNKIYSKNNYKINFNLQEGTALDKRNFKTFYSQTCCLSVIKVDESKRPLSAQNTCENIMIWKVLQWVIRHIYFTNPDDYNLHCCVS
ncbi:retinaldehyde binding protein-related [Schistosoma mansoni]|uniref:retinaldehyde binding protein-related n=1 Tax=Schistosoma mansoni TaxID=6183 RepID=UPI00022DC6FB|nr:retinaldehyde binding protein-related [Schistosoma mansoni]|eukprot:XP_018652223.1 retinaldehyde binding protein-related [Schistosoma mansoni]